jgi:hypothetical protein
VLFLTFPVDYWDYLGWKDTLATPEFTARQNAYRARFRLREIYTPQVVVGGLKEASGGDRRKVEALISDSGPPQRGLRLQMRGETLRVSGRAGPAGAEIWLVRYDPHAREILVKSGENKGKTIVEQNVVRQLKSLGRYKKGGKVVTLPLSPEAGLSTAVLVQGPRGGPVLSVLRP